MGAILSAAGYIILYAIFGVLLVAGMVGAYVALLVIATLYKIGAIRLRMPVRPGTENEHRK